MCQQIPDLQIKNSALLDELERLETINSELNSENSELKIHYMAYDSLQVKIKLFISEKNPTKPRNVRSLVRRNRIPPKKSQNEGGRSRKHKAQQHGSLQKNHKSFLKIIFIVQNCKITYCSSQPQFFSLVTFITMNFEKQITENLLTIAELAMTNKLLYVYKENGNRVTKHMPISLYPSKFINKENYNVLQKK